MVRWYHPPNLVRTGIDVLLSTLFGRHSDPRLLEALNPKNGSTFYDYSSRADVDGRFWLDYAADTGDGWNPTYAVARELAKKQLHFAAPDGSELVAARGSVLVFGGDEVYPVASRGGYRVRLEQVYRAAFAASTGPLPDVFALPGNHDWYDSLASFLRVFCTQRAFGGCATRQERSYFALRLPHDWWIFAVDIQLARDIDGPQTEYFREIAEQFMKGDARIILCTPEPHWIYATRYVKQGYDESNLDFLQECVIRDRGKILLYLSGDLHHYQRYEREQGGIQKITAGGGGAFLHPTHQQPAELKDGFRRALSYPTVRESARLCWRNLLFPFLNPTFGMATAAAYVLIAWLVPRLDQAPTAAAALASAFHEIPRQPLLGAWLVTIVLAWVLFTDTHVAIYRWIAGVTHACAHLCLATVATWLGDRLTVHGLGLAADSWWQFLGVLGVVGAVGWIGGSLLMGVYLLVSLNAFGRHANEAFSSLRIQDFKNFLRLCVEADGRLTLFAIGIDRVPRSWGSSRDGESGPEPDDRRATPAALIETVTITPQERDAHVLGSRVEQKIWRPENRKDQARSGQRH
jgi:hypothetical protein